MASTQRLGPGEALPSVVQGVTEKTPELLTSSRPEPLDPSPFSQTSAPSSPNGWPQERSPGGHTNSASPRSPVPTTLPGLRHAPWQGPRGPSDSPDGSPLTPVPTQMPWLVGSPEPPQSSPTPAFPLATSYDANGPTQPSHRNWEKRTRSLACKGCKRHSSVELPSHCMAAGRQLS